MTPTLTDYLTGTQIRPATREEWARSKHAAAHEPGGTGAFDLDGRSVFVAGDFPPAPEHTPGPWQQHDDHPMYGPGYADAVWTSKGPGFGTVCHCAPYTTAPPESAANARRIVACVNACEGIADPAAALAEVRSLLRAIIRNPGNRYGVENYAEQAFALLDPSPATP